MAHHVFRRCLLADVVPPVPPVVAGGDYRIVAAPISAVIYDFVDGLEFATSVAGLDVMGALFVQPIPPGVDTGLGYYRPSAGSDISLVYDVLPISVHGSRRTSGVPI